MKWQGALVLALLTVAGSASAQGTFSPGHRTGGTFGSTPSSPGARPPSYGAPSQPSHGGTTTAGGVARTYGPPEAPKAPGFEPAKPFTGGSVYNRSGGAGGRAGAKPCETSVYTNACDRRR